MKLNIEFALLNIILSYNYNRKIEYVREVIQEVIDRLNNKKVEWTDEGNIIYGFIILTYGDYGVSPRAGWLRDEDKDIIIKAMTDIQIEFNQYYWNEDKEV